MKEKDPLYLGIQYISNPLELEYIIKNICKDSIESFNSLICNHTRKDTLLKVVSYIKDKHNLSGALEHINISDEDELGIVVFELCALSYRHVLISEIMNIMLHFFKKHMPSETSRLEQLYFRQSS